MKSLLKKKIDIEDLPNKMANFNNIIIPNWVLDSILDMNFNLYKEKKKRRKELFDLNNIFEGSVYDDYWTTGFVKRLLEHDAKFKILDEDHGIETENAFAKLKNYDGTDTEDDFGLEYEGEIPKPFGSYAYDVIMDWELRMRRNFAGINYMWIDGNRFCNLCGIHLHPQEAKKHRKTCFITEKDFDFECWNNFWKNENDDISYYRPSKSYKKYQRRHLVSRENSVNENGTETGNDLEHGIDVCGIYDMKIQQEQAGVEGMSSGASEQPGQIGLISTEVTDQEDSTTIIDPSVGAIMKHPSKLLNTIDQSVNIDSTLTTRLDRITLVKNAIISVDTQGSIIFSLPFPKILLESPAYYGKDIVSLHEYYSCKRLVFTLQIPAELQLVGQIQLTWYPGITGASGSYYLGTKDQIRDNTIDAFSQILDIGNENTIILDVPVSSPLNSLVVGKINDPLAAFDTTVTSMYNEDLWQNYGTLEARVFNDIRGTEEVGDLNYSLYCRAVDSDVQFQTLKRNVTYSNTLKEQGAVVAIAAAVGTAAASAAAAAAPAAGAAIGTAVVGAATTGIVSAIGKNCTIQKTITNDLGTLNASAIHDERPSYVVGLRTSDVESTENETSGLMESTQDVTKMRSRVATLNWKSGDTTGHFLMSNEKIHPAMLYGTTDPDLETDSPRLRLSNLSFINQFFRLYRGSINLEVEVVGNALTRGTLGVVITPPSADNIIPANVIENLGNYAVTNFNVQTTRRVKINVPFNSKYQWNRCPRIHPGIGGGWKTEVYEFLGHLNLIVINPLRIAPISAVNNVDINLYVSSQDMEFYSAIERSDLSFTNYWYNNRESPIPNKSLAGVEQGLSDTLTAEVDILGSTSGLKSPSFNHQDHSDLIALTTQRSPYDSIALRTQYTKINIPLPFAYLKKYSNYDPDNKVCYIDSTLMGALMQCFAWWKGNINLTIMNPQASGTSMTVALRANYAVNSETPRNLLVSESSFLEFSSMTESDNAIIQNFSLNQTNTFSFPWYNNNNCLPSQLVYNNLSNGDGTEDHPPPTYFPYCEVTMIVKTDSLIRDVPYLILAQSAGPGFTLNDFIGCPSVYYGKDYDIPFLLSSQQRSGPRENNITLPIETKMAENLKFSFNRNFPLIHRLVDCTDEIDDQIIHQEQGIFDFGGDVANKANITLDSIESTSDGINDMVRNLEPKLISLTDDFSNLINGDLNSTLGDVNETLKGVKESTEKMSEDFKGTTENANRAIDELSTKLNDILDIVKRKMSPRKNNQSLSGVTTEATEKEIMASLIKCGYDKSIIPFIDQLFCQLFEVANSYIPKDGWHWSWIFGVLSPLIHKYFPNTHFNHKVIAECVHRGFDKIKDQIMFEQGGFEFDKDISGVISIILASIFTVIMSVSLKWAKADALRNFMSIRDVFTFTSGVLTLSKLLETMISGFHKIYKKYINPDLDIEVEWFKRNSDACGEMMHIYLKYKDLSFSSILNRPVAILEILSHRDFCELFLKQTPYIIKTKFKVSELGKAANTLLSMATYIKENREGLPRPSPVSLLFHGATGIGKTYLMQAVIPKIISERLGRKMSTYNKNPESQFWDNYDYQDFVVFDDIGSKQDQEDLKDILLLDGNNPLGLNMASIGDKGKMFISPFLFYTTNSLRIQSSKQYTNREAVDRRLYRNAYTITLRNGFKKEDGTIDKYKVEGKTPDEVYQFTKIERISKNGGELQPEQTRACTFKQIITDVVYQYHDNLKTTPKVHETLVGEYSGMDLSGLISEEQGGITDYLREAFKRNLPGSVNGSSNQGHRNRDSRSNVNFAKKFNESSNYFVKMYRAWGNRELYYDDTTNCMVDLTANKYFESNLYRLQDRIENLIMYASSSTDIDNYESDFYRFIIKTTGLFPEIGYARQLLAGSDRGYNWIMKWAEIGEEMHDSMGDYGGFTDTLRSNFKRGVRGLSIIWGDINDLIYDTVNGQHDLGDKICTILNYINVALLTVFILQTSAMLGGQLGVVKENLKQIMGFDRDPTETWMFEDRLKRQRNHLKQCAEQDIDKRGSVRESTAKAIKAYDYKYEDKLEQHYDKYFPAEEESKMYSTDARDGTSRVRRGVRFSAAKAKPKQNVSVEQNSNDIHSKVASNLGKITNCRNHNYLYILVVESSVILIPHHFFRSSVEGDPCVIEFGQKGQKYEFSINFENLLPITMEENLGDGIWSDPSDHDVAFYSLGFSLSGFRSLRKNFIKHEHIDRIHNQPGSRITISRESGLGMVQTVNKWKINSAVVSITLADGSNKMVQYTDRVCTNLPGSVGMCGSPYLVKNTAYFGDDSVIMGMHQFGTNSTSGGGFVTQDMIQYAIDYFKPISRVKEIVENDETVMKQQNGYFNSDDPLYYSGIRWAKENETCFNFGKTVIRESPLYGLFPPTHGNSALDSFDRRLDDPRSFDNQMINKTNKQYEVKFPLTSDVISRVKKFLVETWSGFTPIREVGVLPIYDVVNGFDTGNSTAWTRETGLLMNKSAGPVYNKVGKGKFPFFDEEILDDSHFTVSELINDPYLQPRPGLKVYTPKSVLTDRIDYRLDLALKGLVPDDSFCGDSIKDELRKLSKIASGSSRVINFFQLDYMVLFAQYFGSFRLLYSDPQNAGPGLFSALACDSTQLFPTLGLDLKDCKRVFGIDYTAYDSSIPPILHEIMVDAINDWYTLHGATEEENQVRKVLWWECIHTQHVYKDVVYTDHHGLPSGVPCGMTTISNIIVNTILFALTCIRLEIPLDCLGRDIIAVFMGDDNLCGVKTNTNSYYNKLTDKFDRIEVAKTATLFGMKATMPDKSPDLTPEDKFDEITFLKSNFINNVNPNQYVPGMDKGTIQNLLTFYKPKGNADVDLNQFCINIHEALRFASLWGYEYYNHLSELLKGSSVINDYFTKDEINSLIPPHSRVYQLVIGCGT